MAGPLRLAGGVLCADCPCRFLAVVLVGILAYPNAVPPTSSRYGISRKGCDGEDHPKPYWDGIPFEDAGGLKEWLDKNKNLNYVEMQIESLQWLLDREKRIGASDADSYFLNVLPLEIRILEHRSKNGDDVKIELNRLIKIRDDKLVDQIPKELLSEN